MTHERIMYDVCPVCGNATIQQKYHFGLDLQNCKTCRFVEGDDVGQAKGAWGLTLRVQEENERLRGLLERWRKDSYGFVEDRVLFDTEGILGIHDELAARAALSVSATKTETESKRTKVPE